LRPGIAWSDGSTPGCGSCIKRCSPNCAAADVSTSGGRSSTAARPAPCAGKKTGPNPTDRRKKGSKHHLITDARGVALVAQVTAANVNDITHLDPMVDALPAVRGRRGHPRRTPDALQGDRGWDSEAHRRRLRGRGIAPLRAGNKTIRAVGRCLEDRHVTVATFYTSNVETYLKGESQIRFVGNVSMLPLDEHSLSSIATSSKALSRARAILIRRPLRVQFVGA
jgi:hypothetical protein